MNHVASDNGKPVKDDFDYASSRAYLQDKQMALQAKRLALWQQAQEDVQKIIEMIIRRYDPQQIIQWGSVLEPEHFSEASDIDLAVAGVDSVLFLRLLADAEVMTEFSLDLIRWEEIQPAFQKVITAKGKVVYAKN
ncbi:MAG: nucleotidyltransferase domain-containing protein [Anaerolineae bacterium]|nr:nucleotidyltransferase domain-containing protein [Anaerolineae bacterium]